MPENTDTASPYTLRAGYRRQRVLIVALIVLAGIVVIGGMGRAPLAGYLLAGLLGVLACLRLLAPPETLGALVVRSRGVDVSVLAILAIGLAVLAGSPNL